MRALFHLSWVNYELWHFMVGIVDEPCCWIDLQRGADDHEDVGLAHDVNSHRGNEDVIGGIQGIVIIDYAII